MSLFNLELLKDNDVTFAQELSLATMFFEINKVKLVRIAMLQKNQTKMPVSVIFWFPVYDMTLLYI